MNVHNMDGEVRRYDEMKNTEPVNHERIDTFIQKMRTFLAPHHHKILSQIYSDGENHKNNNDTKNKLNAIVLLSDLSRIYERNPLCLQKLTFEQQLNEMGDIHNMCSQGRCVRILCVIHSMLSYFIQ